jgi:acetate kinase
MTSILVFNAGSSSLKFAAFSKAGTLRGQVAGIGGKTRFEIAGRATEALPTGLTLAQAFSHAAAWLETQGCGIQAADAIAHRIVHGGTAFVAPVTVDVAVLAKLGELNALAPLHMPAGIGILRAALEKAPDVPQLACFDTAFHATQDPLEIRLPLPLSYHQQGYRRYGFHGLNYEHVVHALPRLTGKVLPQRLLVAHLGSGSSMCAIVDGKSVATSMGYSTADGLIMGTRTGSIDPGVLIALMKEGHRPEEIEDLIYKKSGLLGLSGLSSDMQTLLESGDPRATDAVAHYCHAAARHAGALITVMGGIDALVFTGGVGEHAHLVRAKIVEKLQWLGLCLNENQNKSNLSQISSDASTASIYIVAADEEETMARHAKIHFFARHEIIF